MKAKEHGRRRFLKESVALAGLAVGAIRSASAQTLAPETPAAPPKDFRAYGERSRFVDSVRTFKDGGGPTPHHPHGFLTPIQDSVGIITPSSLHFWEDHGYNLPEIEPRQHRLMIHGMVDRRLIFTLEELQRLPSVSRIHFIECNANSRPRRGPDAESIQIVHGMTSCSEWTGVLLSLLLQEAGVQTGARWILAEGAEAGKYTKSHPLEKALEDVLVAYGQNGEAVRPDQGYPLRLLVPGWQGINNVKWLRRIKVVDQPYMGKRESTDYAELRPDGKAVWFQVELGPYSVITRPSGGQRLPGRGFYEITGLAWSGGGAIRRLEVSTDGGRTWKDAELQGPVHPKAHTRFRFPWNWNGEETLLRSRSTDERGQVQPTVAELAKIWGFPADYYQSVTFLTGNFNAIQTWKITRDGSVQNAMFS